MITNGYTPGIHLVNHEARLIYVPIPKCGSTSIVTYLENECKDFKYVNRGEIYPGYNYIIVLRENVIDRWVSASLESWVTKSPDVEPLAHIMNEIFALRTTGCVRKNDPHYLPQTACILPYMVNPTVFFHDNLKPFHEHLQAHGVASDTEMPHLNAKESDIKLMFHKALSADDRNILNEYYHNDILYISTLTPVQQGKPL